MNFKNLQIRGFRNSAFQIKTPQGKVIHIDPYRVSDTAEEADLILITHPHYDHASIEDINKVVKKGTIVVTPADCQSKISRINEEIDLKVLHAGGTLEFKELGVAIGGVPAYNKDKKFHPKEEGWLGYLMKINGVSIYHAGDTDLIPEMQKLRGRVNLALLPIGGTYTMNPREAAEAAAIILPELAIPMHFGEIAGTEKDAENFVALCRVKRIHAEIIKN